MEKLNKISSEVADLLAEHSLSIAFAESITGGLLASTLVENQGASEYFLGGAVAYANSAKETLLSVPASELEEFGAVSAQIAEAMAQGISSRLSPDIAVSTTGLAGPCTDGSNAQVGEVYIGFCSQGKTSSFRFNFSQNYNRNEIRNLTVYAALDIIKNHISNL